MTMDSITPTNQSVKSKAEYILDALACVELAYIAASEDEIDYPLASYYLGRGQVLATLAIAAPDSAAPANYLAVCRERDEMKRQRDELLVAAIFALRHFKKIGVPAVHVEYLRNAIQNAEQTAEPDAAE